MSYYDPGVGLGACGQLHTSGEYVVALNSIQFDLGKVDSNPNNNANCGKQVQIYKANGQDCNVVATVWDRCKLTPFGSDGAGCVDANGDQGPTCGGYGGLDVSPVVFDATGVPQALGRVRIEWRFL